MQYGGRWRRTCVRMDVQLYTPYKCTYTPAYDIRLKPF